ncbi:MAG TPA: carbamoyltransferase HypF [Spirillospora sp.]|nr:carbamoyltransferase HypF [Spirillospora sp.]
MNREGLRIEIHGAVQGVGFRPFIYRLAAELGLVGWVSNTAQGVVIEVGGAQPVLDVFIRRIQAEKPPLSIIDTINTAPVHFNGCATFEIRHSDDSGGKTALVLPDVATCPDCLREIYDPDNRRYLYPFTNCTNCGPRYSIIESLPYDRPNTTMRHFAMCADCQAEYENPLDRRFHAQPNACPKCGPHLELWGLAGEVLSTRHEAIEAAADALRRGLIVAVKGLGGFHLMVTAHSEPAVQRLRTRKRRPDKPLALMYPLLEMVEADCFVSAQEAELLTSPAAPIVLLRRRPGSSVAPGVAPDNGYLGVMLPYTPLHHLLMSRLDFPVVATSGNLSDEPICIDEYEALDRLGAVADVFLVHNRPIVRHVDDSIVRVVAGQLQILRRARGYAPLPVRVDGVPNGILAVGAHLKNAMALSGGSSVFISQHIGDLETAEAFDAFRRTIASVEMLYEQQPTAIAHDLHPDYLSTQYALQAGLPTTAVQHHHAHVLACVAENQINLPVLGISWDGTGLGTDGTIWGGEFLHTTDAGFTRVAHLRTFRLPGAEQAVKEPRRAAIGLLYEIFGDQVFDTTGFAPLRDLPPQARAVLRTMLARDVNTPVTSSAGRLFDAIASLLDIRHEVSYEGQAAAALEYLLDGARSTEQYPFSFHTDVIDWEPMVCAVLADLREKQPVSLIAAKFHNTLVEMMVAVARRIGEPRIVLTGGCFQNVYLTERAITRLQEAGFQPYWHQQVPPNDGGIALGQMLAAAQMMGKDRSDVPGSTGQNS